MNHRSSLLPLVGLTFAMLLAVACSRTEPTPTPQPPTPTATSEPWIFGDSQAAGYGTFFAAYIEADLGVQVKARSWWENGQSTGRLLYLLRNDQDLRSDLRKARVVTFGSSPTDFIGFRIRNNEGDYDCSPEALAGYQADLEAIINEIFALRQGSPIIIRAVDYYCPLYRQWQAWGPYEEYKRCWEAMNQTIHQAAANHHIPVAEVYAAFNGPNHDEEPLDKGYLGPDGVHTNEAGQKVIADALRKLGYEPIVP